jgi:putative hydrolase of the HAD superfamily
VTRRVLLVDYAEVVSQPQPDGTLADLASLAGLAPDELGRRYWRHRPPYDRGGSAQRYWSDVLGRELSAGDPLLGELVRRDTEAWLHLNDETVAVLTAAQRDGARLALLSNAPPELADAVAAHPAMTIFEHLLFSARLGVAKPDAAAFAAALDVIGEPAGAVVFIDDRAENVEAARASGLDSLLFTTADELQAFLRS